MIQENSGRTGIYIHIPFCKSKCAYCDFYSFVPEHETELFEKYTQTIIKHMEYYKNSCREKTVDSVFIGGGTPTAMPVEYLVKILHAVKKNFNIEKNAEISIEVNPATADIKTFRKLRFAGVNRVSIGLQTADEKELKALSRIHTRSQFNQCFMDARKAKIENINVDVMFGIPMQSVESLLRTLAYVTNLSPEHISLYDLKVEPGTKFGKMGDQLILPDEDTECEMYYTAIDFLAGHGYYQYEISNFAKPGKSCRHNLKYWNCDEYIGFGPAAHSFFNKTRFSFVRNIKQYMDGIENVDSNIEIISGMEEITGKAGMGEYVMLRLRLTEGIPLGEFYRKFGVDFLEMYGVKVDFYIKRGFMKMTRDNVFLTPTGMFVSNYILSDILSFEDLNAVAPIIN